MQRRNKIFQTPPKNLRLIIKCFKIFSFYNCSRRCQKLIKNVERYLRGVNSSSAHEDQVFTYCKLRKSDPTDLPRNRLWDAFSVFHHGCWWAQHLEAKHKIYPFYIINSLLNKHLLFPYLDQQSRLHLRLVGVLRVRLSWLMELGPMPRTHFPLAQQHKLTN